VTCPATQPTTSELRQKPQNVVTCQIPVVVKPPPSPPVKMLRARSPPPPPPPPPPRRPERSKPPPKHWIPRLWFHTGPLERGGRFFRRSQKSFHCTVLRSAPPLPRARACSHASRPLQRAPPPLVIAQSALLSITCRYVEGLRVNASLARAALPQFSRFCRFPRLERPLLVQLPFARCYLRCVAFGLLPCNHSNFVGAASPGFMLFGSPARAALPQFSRFCRFPRLERPLLVQLPFSSFPPSPPSASYPFFSEMKSSA
jgi:hypothetical protein